MPNTLGSYQKVSGFIPGGRGFIGKWFYTGREKSGIFWNVPGALRGLKPFGSGNPKGAIPRRAPEPSGMFKTSPARYETTYR